MRLICYHTQNYAIWVLIAPFLTNHEIAKKTIDFKMNVIVKVIERGRVKLKFNFTRVFTNLRKFENTSEIKP